MTQMRTMIEGNAQDSNELTTRHRTHLVGEGNNRRCCARTFRVLNHSRLPAFHHGDARVGRSEIDTDNLPRDFAVDRKRGQGV